MHSANNVHLEISPNSNFGWREGTGNNLRQLTRCTNTSFNSCLQFSKDEERILWKWGLHFDQRNRAASTIMSLSFIRIADWQENMQCNTKLKDLVFFRLSWRSWPTYVFVSLIRMEKTLIERQPWLSSLDHLVTVVRYKPC